MRQILNHSGGEIGGTRMDTFWGGQSAFEPKELKIGFCAQGLKGTNRAQTLITILCISLVFFCPLRIDCLQ